MELLKSYLTADFFTHSYRISGQVDTGHKHLSEMLNDKLTSYLELRKAFVSRISRPSEIIATHAVSALRKEGVLFVVLAAQEQSVTNRTSYSFAPRRPYDVFLTVPFFEIEGSLEIAGKLDLKTVLVMKGAFLSLSESEARLSSPAGIAFSGEEILVNQSWIELFCITEAAS
jgi:hypothetical protein